MCKLLILPHKTHSILLLFIYFDFLDFFTLSSHLVKIKYFLPVSSELWIKAVRAVTNADRQRYLNCVSWGSLCYWCFWSGGTSPPPEWSCLSSRSRCETQRGSSSPSCPCRTHLRCQRGFGGSTWSPAPSWPRCLTRRLASSPRLLTRPGAPLWRPSASLHPSQAGTHTHIVRQIYYCWRERLLRCQVPLKQFHILQPQQCQIILPTSTLPSPEQFVRLLDCFRRLSRKRSLLVFWNVTETFLLLFYWAAHVFERGRRILTWSQVSSLSEQVSSQVTSLHKQIQV